MLKNVKKIILFINLLNSRDFITFSQANEVCGLSRRSFYRYIKLLTEINMPVHYDRKLRGYKLTNKINNKQMNFSTNEIILILVGLIKSLSRANDIYQEEINELILKLISTANFDIEKSIESLNHDIDQTTQNSDYTSLLNSLILEVSMNNNLQIKTFYKKANSILKAKINKPIIEFKNIWMLKDRENGTSIPMDSIQYLKLL